MRIEEKRKVGAKVLYPELSYVLTGILFEAHKQLGRFGREKQYGDFIEKNLKEQKIQYGREVAIASRGNIMDFIVDDKIVLELKADRVITKEYYRQIQNNLQQAKIKLGILVNFRDSKLTPKRIIRIDSAVNSHESDNS